ncbi:hypothetical protein BLNAU_5495 [Blattamonas nauphoetae]|uniref:LRAT domain-containing protein n=1 Tax=Blattamonas nauphoetae TaxID=2049346 RepID=A0ABQ9Y6T1_9EUKA|nr:hypothetical protein BLNAU_5495 [Blattamonas nauphoetae]
MSSASLATIFILSDLLLSSDHIAEVPQSLYDSDQTKMLAHVVSAVHTSLHVHPNEPNALSGDVIGMSIDFGPKGIRVLVESYGSYVGRTLQRTGHTLIRNGLTGDDLNEWLVRNSEKYDADNYRLMSRNCQHFALELYGYLTREPGALALIPFGVINMCTGLHKIIVSLIIFVGLPIAAFVSVCIQTLCQKRNRSTRSSCPQKCSSSSAIESEEGLMIWDASVADGHVMSLKEQLDDSGLSKVFGLGLAHSFLFFVDLVLKNRYKLARMTSFAIACLSGLAIVAIFPTARDKALSSFKRKLLFQHIQPVELEKVKYIHIIS